VPAPFEFCNTLLGYGMLPAAFVARCYLTSKGVDIEQNAASGPTGCYDQNGSINHELLNQYASEFDRPG